MITIKLTEPKTANHLDTRAGHRHRWSQPVGPPLASPGTC